MNDVLKETYTSLLENYSNDLVTIEHSWLKIVNAHNSNERFYHNLQHLENLQLQLLEVKSEITEWHTILFTLFYHDLIYDTSRNDNEFRSSLFAIKEMHLFNVSEETINRCQKQILATQNHLFSEDNDTNYFLDADLSILGKQWDEYQEYAKNVRLEYSIYADDLYFNGRKNVLNHFLKMNKIYKTDYFFDKYETQAKQNLQKELNLIR